MNGKPSLVGGNSVCVPTHSEEVGVNFEGGAWKRMGFGCPSPSSDSRLGNYLEDKTVLVDLGELKSFQPSSRLSCGASGLQVSGPGQSSHQQDGQARRLQLRRSTLTQALGSEQ